MEDMEVDDVDVLVEDHSDVQQEGIPFDDDPWGHSDFGDVDDEVDDERVEHDGDLPAVEDYDDAEDALNEQMAVDAPIADAQAPAVAADAGPSKLKTVSFALFSALEPKYAELTNARIQSTVKRIDELRSHAYHIAALAFEQLASMNDAQILQLEGLSDCYSLVITTKCCHPALFRHIVAVANASDPLDRPAGVGNWLWNLSQEYFDGLDRPSLSGHPDNEELIMILSSTRNEIAREMEIAFKNCLQFSTPGHMLTFIKQKYYTTTKEAKAACAHIGTSLDGKRAFVREMQINDAYARARQHQREVELAETPHKKRHAEQALQRCNAELIRIKNTVLTNEEVNKAIDKAFPLNPVRIQHQKLPEGVHLWSLAEIVATETSKLKIEKNTTQMDQLRLRYRMLMRFPVIGKKFSLVPMCGVGRAFVRFCHEQIMLLVPGGAQTVRNRMVADVAKAERDRKAKLVIDDLIKCRAEAARDLAIERERSKGATPYAAFSAGVGAFAHAVAAERDNITRNSRTAAATRAAISKVIANQAATIRQATMTEARRLAVNAFVKTAVAAARVGAYNQAIATGAGQAAARLAGIRAAGVAGTTARTSEGAIDAGNVAARGAAYDACLHAAGVRAVNAATAAEYVACANGMVAAAAAYVESATAMAVRANVVRARLGVLREEADRAAVRSAARDRTAAIFDLEAEESASRLGDGASDSAIAAATADREAADFAHAEAARLQVAANTARSWYDRAVRFVETADLDLRNAHQAQDDAAAALAAARAAEARSAAMPDNVQMGNRHRAEHMQRCETNPDTRRGMTTTAMSLLFKWRIVNGVQSVTWQMGDSFLTDGIQVQFNVMTRGARAAKTDQTARGQKTKQTKKQFIDADLRLQVLHDQIRDASAAAEQGQPGAANELVQLKAHHKAHKLQLGHQYDTDLKAQRIRDGKEKAAKRSTAPLGPSKAEKLVAEHATLPKDPVFIGVDPGKRNLCGVNRDRARAAEDPVGTEYEWEFSEGSWRHATGQKQRQIETNKALAHARKNADKTPSAFAAAQDAFNAADFKTTVHADLLQAVRTRARHYPAMYAFYGHQTRARVKFANKIGAQKVLRALVNRISPPATRARDVVVVGDAINNAHAMRGSVSPKLVRALKAAGVRCVVVDEFRTSMLDAVRHIPMFHPPKMVTKHVNGVRTDRLFNNYCVLQASMPGYSRTCSRDANAAKNIREKYQYMLANEGRVPDAFVRGSAAPLRFGNEKVRRYRYRLREVEERDRRPGFVRTSWID